MRKTNVPQGRTNTTPVLVDTTGLQEILNAGKSSAVQIGTAAGARVQVGRRVFWNVSKVQEYVNCISE